MIRKGSREKPKTSIIITEFGELCFVPDNTFRYPDKTKIVIKGEVFLMTNSETPLMTIYMKMNSATELGNLLGISNKLLTPFFTGNYGAIYSIAGDVDLRTYSKTEINDRETRALEIIIDILVQMETLLELYKLHNDVKPQNIIRIKNRWFLIDHEMHINFGSVDELLKCLDFFGIITSQSGTSGYFSPEKQDSGLITVNGDIYSLGLSILEFISANSVFGYEKTYIDEHVNSPELRSVLKNMLDSNYSTRSTINQCLEEISKFKFSEIVEARSFYSNTNYFKSNISEKIKEMQLF